MLLRFRWICGRVVRSSDRVNVFYFIRNLHVEYRKIKKLLELNYYYFLNKKHYIDISFPVEKGRLLSFIVYLVITLQKKNINSNSKSNIFISQVT